VLVGGEDQQQAGPELDMPESSSFRSGSALDMILHLVRSYSIIKLAGIFTYWYKLTITTGTYW
jgi:hypothetical protein